MTVPVALKVLGLLFAFYVLTHWLSAGQDEIIDGPPEAPLYSQYAPTNP